MATILLVEGDRSLIGTIVRTLGHAGHKTLLAATGQQARTVLDDTRPDLAVVDLSLPDTSGLDVVEHLRRQYSDVPTIVLADAFDDFEPSREARLGITTWLSKPIDDERMLSAITSVLAGERPPLPSEAVRSAVGGPGTTFDGMVGRSPAMVEVYRLISQLAPLAGSVLIQGETGTGKELVARSLHHRSGRRGKALVAVHAGAIPETLFETQMFGHEAGAFTDARNAQAGWFETANGGTLFLDEIGEMPLAAQAKLLRVMEERRVARLGSRRFVPIDVRIIAATNRNLSEAVASGLFRGDLYFRFGSTLNLPALSRRDGDVDLLIDHLLPRLAEELNTPAEICEDARAVLRRRTWPGNVRELERVLRAALMIAGGDLVRPEHVRSPDLDTAHLAFDVRDGALADLTLPEATRRLHDRMVTLALSRTNGNRKEAARQLGVDVKTLRRRLQD